LENENEICKKNTVVYKKGEDEDDKKYSGLQKKFMKMKTTFVKNKGVRRKKVENEDDICKKYSGPQKKKKEDEICKKYSGLPKKGKTKTT